VIADEEDLSPDRTFSFLRISSSGVFSVTSDALGLLRSYFSAATLFLGTEAHHGPFDLADLDEDGHGPHTPCPCLRLPVPLGGVVFL